MRIIKNEILFAISDGIELMDFVPLFQMFWK